MNRVEKRAQEIADFDWNGKIIPGYMIDPLARYIEEGQGVGDFLGAVLSNDLLKTYTHADESNKKVIEAYVGYLYNYAPAGCYGSGIQFLAWIAVGGLKGKEAADVHGA